VTALAQADIDAILAVVGEAARSTETQPFASQLMPALRDLARADDILFSELDRVRQRTIRLTTAEGPVPLDAVGKPGAALTYWQIRHEHPVCAYRDRTGDYRALRVSDFVSRRQLRGSRLYREWFKPRGIATEMTAGLDAPRWHTKVFLFQRASGEFSERDRAVVEAVRPMLRRLHEASLSRGRIAAALELLGDHHTAGPAALVILDGAGRPDFMTGPAQALFARLGAAPGRLPEAVEARLKARQRVDPGDAMVVPCGGIELIVHRSRDALLFDVRVRMPSLTGREHTILELVAGGQTNAQVARELSISPGTVRRHLENAYAKLGVHTRTAAVARLANRAAARPE
jgi:DNA-binding CsgD family transcriptional regulator